MAKRVKRMKRTAGETPRRPADGASTAALTTIFGSRATLICVLIIVAVGLVFFGRVVFLGEILTGGDVLAGAAIFEQYANEEIAGGHLPLWNPYMFGGMPFFESMTWSAFVYPSFWIRFLIEKIPGVELPRLFVLVMHYLLAGLGTFFFLRSRSVGHAGAAVGGLAFMLSPHLIGLATIGHGGKVLTGAYIPLILMAAARVFESGERRWIAILALVGGLQFLARHVQVSYYTWLAVLLLLIVSIVAGRRAGDRWAGLARGSGMVVGGGILAAALAAILLLPLLEYADLSTRVADAGGMGFDQATMWSFHPKEIVTFFVPSLFGLANESYWGPMPFEQVSHYMGYVVLCLAAVAVVRRRNRDVGFLTVLLAVGLVLSFGKYLGPFYRFLYAALPGFSRFRVPALFLLLTQFAGAALAGHGASVLLGEVRARPAGRLSWAIGTAAVGIAFGAIVLLARSGLAQSAATTLMTKHVGVPAASLRQVAAQAARLAGRDAGILIAFAAATGVAFYVAASRKVMGWIAAALVMGIVVWDVAVVDSRFMQPVRMRPLGQYYPTTAATAYIKAQPGPFRVLPLGGEFSSNAWMFHRIESVGGYHPAKLTVIDRLFDTAGLANLKVLQVLNVRYVFGPEDLGNEAFRRVAPGVHEFLAGLPRVYLIGEAKHLKNEAFMLSEYFIDSFDPASYATVIDDLPGPVESVEGSTATIVSYNPREIEVAASVRRPCLLVFSEVYYPPGWKAFVDGEETEIFRTNYAFRSVYLEPGDHTVRMEHVAPALSRGLVVTLAAALLIAALWALPAAARRRE
jgi:hypothetical protein